MTNVSKWLKLAREPPPSETKCTFGIYKGWHWKTICEKDPEYILWLITESQHLLPRELEEYLLSFIKGLTAG